MLYVVLQQSVSMVIGRAGLTQVLVAVLTDAHGRFVGTVEAPGVREFQQLLVDQHFHDRVSPHLLGDITDGHPLPPGEVQLLSTLETRRLGGHHLQRVTETLPAGEVATGKEGGTQAQAPTVGAVCQGGGGRRGRWQSSCCHDDVLVDLFEGKKTKHVITVKNDKKAREIE